MQVSEDTATTSTRNLALMSRSTVGFIHRLVNRGILKPNHRKHNAMYFNDAYARRVAPLIACRYRMASSLGCWLNRYSRREE